MKRVQGKILLGVGLMVLSAALFLLQVNIFHDARDTFFYLFQDLAFVPIQVLLVTVIVDQVIRIRERISMMTKLNMVIGTFFSEVGTKLMKSLAGFDSHFDKIRNDFMVNGEWTDQKFSSVIKRVGSYDYRIDYMRSDMAALKALLSEKRDFLLRLLENPNLLEHETFTELLWAVFHLTEELVAREDVIRLSPVDGNHIAGDIKRAYVILIAEWLAYMKHLKKEYPYLFSLAVRTNPSDPNASVVVK
jgi:hypothetical protein